MAFVQGDSRAFERIWRRLKPACEVLLASRFRTGLEPAMRPLLESELEDILQEAAVSIFGKLREFEYRGQGSLLAWTSTIAVRVAQDRVDYWRAGKRSRPRQLDATSRLTASGLRDPGPGGVTRIDQADKRRQLAEVLSLLPDRFQTIVLWRFFAGAQWQEIAEAVGSPSAEAVKMECLLKVLPAIAAAIAKRRGDQRRAEDGGGANG